ncbi:hypothetical protein SSAG_04774 [Streptomyces sp. Mg1]|nr:hypothetical protein SSAG_04774 [Streptomyces sp. Mg1]
MIRSSGPYARCHLRRPWHGVRGLPRHPPTPRLHEALAGRTP